MGSHLRFAFPRRGRVPAFQIAVALMGLAKCSLSAIVAAGETATRAALPNIVYVMTDDQDVELGGLTPMRKTRRLLGENGAVLGSAYIATPICAPSRTETLSGRVYHNVLSDDLSGRMHVNATGYVFQHRAAVVPALQSAGYWTGGFGKIMNGQGRIFVGKDEEWENDGWEGQENKKHARYGNASSGLTTGWDWLSAPMSEGDYFGTQIFNKRPNGSMWVESLGKKEDVVDEWYQTSQIGNRSIEFMRTAIGKGVPFFAYLGPHAPHYSADSPPWARNEFTDLQAPRTPAYNTSVGQDDKTRHVQQNPPLTMEAAKWIDIHFRNRWRAILGVDDMVGELVSFLDHQGVLNNTYILFTSDHGYKLGQWRIGCSKEHPYETDVHIPFLMRGPGIAPGTRVPSLVSNIDLAPTLLEIAGLPPNPEHDGKSVLPLVTSVQGSQKRQAAEASWKTSQFIAYISVGTYYNDHASLWLSGPAAKPGTPVQYGKGPYSTNEQFPEERCAETEGHNANATGQGTCYFVDSQASNNWIALRVRNSTHNYVYVESFGAKAIASAPFEGEGHGIFKCLEGDFCQFEYYDYGPIDPHENFSDYPVMKDARWCIENKFSTLDKAIQEALHQEIKSEYCTSRRLDIDRMGCK